MPSSITCPGCASEFPKNVLEERLYVCETCHRHLAMPARARIDSLADAGSFREFDRTLVSQDPLKFETYRKRLKEARRGTGAGEAVTTGFCLIDGHAAVLLVFDFEFMGGTMGSVVGEKIAHAFEEAMRRKLPVVSVTATGGARVQEGMLSLMQMAKVAGAAERHGQAGLAFISILTDPTFGGVTASFASLGDVILAEPGAQIGFVGPRVIAQTTGVAPPKDSHHAETLLQAGLIDLVVPRTELRCVVAYLVGHLCRQEATSASKPVRGERRARVRPAASRRKPDDSKQLPAWENVGIARHTGRPTARLYIARMCTQFLELHGDRWGGDDHAIVGGPAELDGQTVFMIAQDRGATPEEAVVSHGGMAFSYGYRKALRLMRLAAKFGIPVVTLVDTPNAQASFESEHSGIAYALANSLAGMSSLPTPIVSVIIGQGGSGGAVALAVADRVLMLEHAIYSVISPEGAASILYRDVERASTVAESLKLAAHDLLRLGIIDAVVPEPAGGAHSDADAAAATLKVFVCDALRELRAIPTQRLVAMRYEKYRHIGRVGVSWRGLARRAFRRAARFVVRLKPRQTHPSAGASIR
jgi:acetyl-CoA carboxylase carboxyl transferase beta subunit/acetyl-CoA carboxylase carboxyl transferase alpha subunit